MKLTTERDLYLIKKTKKDRKFKCDYITIAYDQIYSNDDIVETSWKVIRNIVRNTLHLKDVILNN